MHIAILGTKASGGINSVIAAYIQDGLYADCSFTRIDTHAGVSKWHDLFLAIRSFFVLFFILIFKKDVIVHAHMSMNGSFWRKVIYLWLSKLLGGKFIIHLHGSEFKLFYQHSASWVRRLIQHAFESADSVIVLSDSWANYISSIAKSNVLVVNNYVDVVRSNTCREKGQILFLGAFIQRKGIYDLLNAFAAINKNKSYILHLCGGGEDDKVNVEINSIGIKDSVILHGWIGAELKSKLLQQCSVLILPSYNEGLPMVVIEAMGSNIPLITTPVGGIPDVIDNEKSCLFVQAGNRAEIGSALERILNEGELGLQLATAARAIYDKSFTSAVAFPKLKAEYRRLIA